MKKSDESAKKEVNLMTFEIQEITVSAMLKRGKFQSETYYGSTVVKPKPAMIIQVPVGDLPGLEALQVAMAAIELTCTNSVNDMMEKAPIVSDAQLPEVKAEVKAEVKVVEVKKDTKEVKFVSAGQEPGEEF